MRKSVLRKITSLLVVVALVIGMTTPAYAKENVIQVQLNGENISFDVAPKMVNSRVLVPMRAVFEELGAKVEWDDKTSTVTATKGGTSIKLKANSRSASITKKGIKKDVHLDVAATVVKGRTLVPVRFVSESLGVQVGWDEKNKTVVLIDYGYFLGILKSQAPNFYEYATNKYEQINTGEVNSSGNVSFRYDSINDPASSLAGAVNAKFKAKINEENGSLDADIKLTGLKDVMKEAGLEGVDNISLNFCFDNNSFYVKSNLFSIMPETKDFIGDKWVKADIADLGIPEVNTLQDLKKMQSGNSSQDQLRDSLINSPMELDVKSFAKTQKIFNALIKLIDNNHFKITNLGDMKVYNWNINKADIVDVVLNIEKNLGSGSEMTLEEMLEMKKFVDGLEFNFKMEVGVKNNIIVNSKTSLQTKMNIPEEGKLELSLEINSQVSNPNNNITFVVPFPKPNEVISLRDLQTGATDLTEQM